MKPTYYTIDHYNGSVVDISEGKKYNGGTVFPTRQLALIALHCTLRKSCEDYQRRIDEIVVSATAIEKEIEELIKPFTSVGGAPVESEGGC